MIPVEGAATALPYNGCASNAHVMQIDANGRSECRAGLRVARKMPATTRPKPLHVIQEGTSPSNAHASAACKCNGHMLPDFGRGSIVPRKSRHFMFGHLNLPSNDRSASAPRTGMCRRQARAVGLRLGARSRDHPFRKRTRRDCCGDSYLTGCRILFASDRSFAAFHALRPGCGES